MPCPLDPKHSVWLSELKTHVEEKCNARLPSASYVQWNVNTTIDTPLVEGSMGLRSANVKTESRQVKT